jgi:predicted MFS family arabinose efflux permease
MNETLPKPWPNPAYAGYVVVLLVLSYALGVVDRIVIGLLVNPIKEDLKLSDTEIGIIQGLAFALFYSLFTLPVGYLVDRWKRVPVVWAGLAGKIASQTPCLARIRSTADSQRSARSICPAKRET